MALVGRQAPAVNAKAVVNGQEVVDFSLDQYLGKQYVLLFFYPKDFTFVCPTELHAFQNALEEFKARDTAVVGVSTDTENSHHAWLQLEKNKGGIKGVTYPLVADTNKTIATNYDVLAGEYEMGEEGELVSTSEMVAYRGLFLIDKQGVIQHQLVNNMPLGRNVAEALRMVDALQHLEQHGEVCPAGWAKGQDAMKPNLESTANYLASH